MARVVAVDVLLALGCVIITASGVALWLVRTTYDRVHVVAPAAMLGIPLLAVALVVDQGVSPLSLKGLAVVLLLWLGTPTLSHATLRAARFRAAHGREAVDR